ncbi:sugar ABC transporter permease [Caldibacillus thermolactis]|jgi:raffinose/stachyose/melibiose transport system permease protein|uniref:Sugar ABC transporter permease n=1 Tax=Pallidibacillus thermolactis TaxID=251051 RepID=A0ABT2WCZ8_9BACI|nr:sugar ABC transporter permease [Pallidibacillus thermolactis]MCU9593557.1 sugar ABC transporter permease [Pallidibacillus thermolactis]MED1674486.1 sugar ABC transporter permease [Pallidibacillus thermolactis subsp. kokeshiiformis]
MDSNNSSLKIENRKKRMAILLFVLPALLVYTIFIIYPILATFNYSLFEWNGISKEKVFIGFENFKNLLYDSTFWLALKNNVYLILVSVFVQIPLGLIMALVLLSKIRGKKILNVIYFLPFLMSAVAIGLLWTLMYDPVNGPINKFLEFFGIDSIHWLASNKTAIVAVLVVIVWQFAPFYMILFKAAMVGIPEELYEAADIDGANEAQKFFYVTLPSLMPTIVSSSILAVVGSLKTFDMFYIMLGGGSGSATEILGTYMYKQSFINFNMGYGSAIASMMFILALISVILILITDGLRQRRESLK